MKPLNEYCIQVSSIDEYLSTKVKLNKWRKFPETPKVSDIEEFLLSKGFNKYIVTYWPNNSQISFIDFYKKSDKRFCIYSYSTYYEVRLAEGHLSEKTPMFFLFATDDGHIFNKEYITDKNTKQTCVGSLEDYNHIYKYFDTYESFLEAINLYFNW